MECVVDSAHLSPFCMAVVLTLAIGIPSLSVQLVRRFSVGHHSRKLELIATFGKEMKGKPPNNSVVKGQGGLRSK